MLFALHPDAIVFDLGSALIVELDLSTDWIGSGSTGYCTFADKRSTRNTLTFQFNYPHSSALGNSLDFDIVNVHQVGVVVVCCEMIWAVRLQER